MALEPIAPEQPSEAVLQPGGWEDLDSYSSQEQGSLGSSGFNFVLASISIAVSMQPQLKPKFACLPGVLPQRRLHCSLLIQIDPGQRSQGLQASSAASFLGSTQVHLESWSHGRCWHDSCWFHYCLPWLAAAFSKLLLWSLESTFHFGNHACWYFQNYFLTLPAQWEILQAFFTCNLHINRFENDKISSLQMFWDLATSSVNVGI